MSSRIFHEISYFIRSNLTPREGLLWVHLPVFTRMLNVFLQDEHVDANFDDEISTYLYAITSSRSSIHNKTKQNTLTTGKS